LNVRELATEVGLDLVGAVPVGPSPTWHHYTDWVAHGYAAGMGYLMRPEAVRRRADPRHVMAEARTVLVVGASYAGPGAAPTPPLHGGVARYAWGADYHDGLLTRLKRLTELIDEAHPEPVSARCYVDTGPVLERAWAEAAGLGWAGKNTNLIHPRLGSFVFLGVALLDIEPPPAEAAKSAMPTCGSCSACMEACPTGAIVAPGVLDARRCLSYLTIEHRGAIPEELRTAMGTRVFGCDTCQDVCPWNRRVVTGFGGTLASDGVSLYLPELLTLDPEGFRARFRRSPIWRAKPAGLARNAAVALGNYGDAAARPFLVAAAEHHPEELVREHAAWALTRLS